ncbi:MAG TPA: hypothetical protein VD997_16150 [Phycisphaerales bacterium]|nr:hypothetical protein [Phycisphaerales bacterium]
MIPTYANAILSAAAEVEEAELAIKAAITAAATVGDCARVSELMAAWATTPAVELAARIRAHKPVTNKDLIHAGPLG